MVYSLCVDNFVAIGCDGTKIEAIITDYHVKQLDLTGEGDLVALYCMQKIRSSSHRAGHDL